MAADKFACSICHERFEKREYAERCEAQGVPPSPYRRGDVLVRQKATPLVVIETIRVHHGRGQCPINGPCEHAISFTGYQLWPDRWMKSVAWVAGARGEVTYENWQIVQPGHTRIARLTQSWGIVPKDGDPADYLQGLDVAEDWERLWALYPSPRVGRTRPLSLSFADEGETR